MPKDHLWRVTSFQGHAVNVLNLGKPVADERMAKRVVLPPDSCLASSPNHGFEEAIFAVWPDAITVARRYRQPLREIVCDRHDAPRCCLGLVRANFDVPRTSFNV
jgi:hypothetical protein